MVVASSAQQGVSTQSETRGATADGTGAAYFREHYSSAPVSETESSASPCRQELIFSGVRGPLLSHQHVSQVSTQCIVEPSLLMIKVSRGTEVTGQRPVSQRGSLFIYLFLGRGGGWMLHRGEPLEPSLEPAAVLVRLAADDGTVFGVFCTAQMTARELGHSQASADTQSQLT